MDPGYLCNAANHIYITQRLRKILCSICPTADATMGSKENSPGFADMGK